MQQRKNDRERELINAGIAGASYETVQRYGSAIKEHLVAYSGVDNEVIDPATGAAKVLKKSLKSIKAQKTNAEYDFAIKQQKAGWAAEVKETANTNAERIISGDSKRKIRYDDLPNKSANHPLYDHVEIDNNGNIVAKSETQMKFIGASKNDPKGIGNPDRALKKLQSKSFQKYLDNDVKIQVPKDEYDTMIKKATEEIEALEKQLKKAKSMGNTEAVSQLEKKIENLHKIKKNLKPSSLTRKEANEAANTPIKSTAKSVAKVSHRAGLQAAEMSAIIGGSASLVKNVVGICQGDIENSDAVKNVVKDTAHSAVVGYGTGFAGSAIKGVMQNSASEYTRALAKTNIASTLVTVTMSATKTLKSYFDGEIDEIQCLESLGEQGTGMIASSMFTVIGQAVIPIPIVGGLIGGMIGYAFSSATYGIFTTSLKEAKLAHEERIAIEQACEEHIKMIREYRLQMNEIIETYLSDTMEIFNQSFTSIKAALEIGDVDLFIESTNSITDAFGGNKPFNTMDEFNEKMLSGIAFKL